ncbi:MAG TPA: ATP-dependent helicase C-terminal domain-containing protein, partial [Bryobacteraceae bacterium]
GIERFVDREELDRFLRRVRFASQHSAIVIPNDLLAAAVRRLAEGRSSFAQLRDATKGGGLLAALQSQLPMREIDEVAPAFVTLPGRRRARIEYHDGRPPSVASRLQDFFGMKETPSVARGTVPLVVQLLAPNQRPVQVTTDLVSFWKNLYPQVRRELSRRYPKHAWPEIPI